MESMREVMFSTELSDNPKGGGGGGGGGLTWKARWGCLFWIKSLKKTNLGMVQALFDP